MTIVNVKELPRTHSQNYKYQRQYQRKYLVQTTVGNDDPLNIINANDGVTAIPALYAPYPSDSFALVQDRKANQRSDLFFWDVEVSYNSVFDVDPASQDENPLSRPAIWSFSFEKAEKAVRYDLDDEPIDNSATVPIDPPLMLEHSIPIISISVNKATFSYATVSVLQDCVNSDTWNGFAPNTVKIRGIEVNVVWENNVLYFAYKWTLAVKYDAWRPVKILDMGYHEYNAGEPKLIRDAYGNPLPQPSLLDGNGEKLPDGDDPVYLDFNMNRQVAFTGLIP